jgi:hypothetical protein
MRVIDRERETIVIPLVDEDGRAVAADVVRIIMAPVRGVAWVLGALLGSLVAGFVCGWRDAA